jgi:hypothetical protein
VANFDCTKWQYVNGLNFGCKDGDELQITYEWSRDETIYVDHIYHPCGMRLHYGKLSFTTLDVTSLMQLMDFLSQMLIVTSL